ncbi:MAG: TIGR04282 family arsenosugar biosynthesis glycosyltransferase [Acidobacteria bacterium]|nr:TIGR04282 family arsenosugar biosynthesis glycosyltransferase [Acidobacteriota bacterium]
MRPVMIVFAKAPVPGRVKTRLRLAPEAAAALHSAFVLDTLETVQTLGFDVELHNDISTSAWPGWGFPRRVQHEGDLGLKMLKALTEALVRGHPRAAIVGSDSPDLPPEYLTRLMAPGTDVALGPTEDGGYYAIAASRVGERMFSAVRWSTAHALDDTVEACRRAGLSTRLGDRWYDVDDAEALERLARSPRLGQRSRAALESLAAVRFGPTAVKPA